MEKENESFWLAQPEPKPKSYIKSLWSEECCPQELPSQSVEQFYKEVWADHTMLVDSHPKKTAVNKSTAVLD